MTAPTELRTSVIRVQGHHITVRRTTLRPEDPSRSAAPGLAAVPTLPAEPSRPAEQTAEQTADQPRTLDHQEP
ncbi:hypothetical protein CSO01_16220 [Cellulomonas soli]|uniref:Uncharacterized protein n=1 Tax=Cellulomonas soli TaxID=931535 RepID=A0A512PCH6_9CELL|nr:hypothetical protein [Cellulomonas soli]GEP68907.1 hypothetical protein CSO01_16220 [Cellulomonas soli]